MSKKKKRLIDLDRDGYRRDGQDFNNRGEYSIRGNYKEPKEDRYKKNVIVSAQTEGQKEYIIAIKNNSITFCCGPAGCGKTAVSVGIALQYMMAPQPSFEKLIVMRPAKEACDEKIGFLPGDMGDKMSVWISPVVDNMEVFIDKSQIKNLFYQEKVEVIPTAFARGRSLNNAFIIVDEAQNLSQQQMIMILTRLGKNSKMVLNGDLAQSDLKVESGLYDAMQRLQDIEGIGFCEMQNSDIVRNPLIGSILDRYMEPDSKES